VALAFSRAGLSWDDAVVVSAHGRSPRAAVNAALAHPKVAVLTEPRFTPADLARALADGPPRRMVVAERLGDPEEGVVEGTPAELAGRSFGEPNVALVLDPERPAGARAEAWPPRAPSDGWALPEEGFAHRDGMITKAEVRALALARLGPGLGELVWDVGAGSGAVGVECARLGAAVVAVERDPDACALVAENARRHGVAVRVVAAAAPAALADLPDPDAVFVGGGGRDLEAILDVACARARRRVVTALAAVDRVAPALARLQAAGLSADGAMVQASRLRALGGERRLAAANPVFVLWGVRA
jgi:precorrin-6Y C5,15-methyltransferase (decarboxylating)